MLCKSRLVFDGGDAKAIQEYFHRMQSQDINFFYSFDVGEDGCLRNLFWADFSCRLSYKIFGDVYLLILHILLIDIRYLLPHL